MPRRADVAEVLFQQPPDRVPVDLAPRVALVVGTIFKKRTPLVRHDSVQQVPLFGPERRARLFQGGPRAPLPLHLSQIWVGLFFILFGALKWNRGTKFGDTNEEEGNEWKGAVPYPGSHEGQEARHYEAKDEGKHEAKDEGKHEGKHDEAKDGEGGAYLEKAKDAEGTEAKDAEGTEAKEEGSHGSKEQRLVV